REFELAVGTDAEHAEPRRGKAHLVAVARPHVADAGGHEQAPAGVDAERPYMVGERIDALDPARLAGRLIDGEYGNAVFPARKYPLAVLLDRAVRTVRRVHEAPARVDVNRAGRLA